jgi:hypothetical protein
MEITTIIEKVNNNHNIIFVYKGNEYTLELSRNILD